jgi:hypothetical protein
MRKMIYGGDTETMRGRPISFQFYGENRSDMIFISDADKATSILLKWCKSLPSRAQHVVYVHNLEFDMVSFFWDHRDELVAQRSGEFDFTIDGWRIHGAYGAPTFCYLSDSGENKSVILVDSFSYYRASLAKAADVFCPGLPKLKAPDGLGEKLFKRNDEQFIDYAMRDSVIAYHIGVALEKLHDEFSIGQTVSVADMAARIFRHKFMTKPIPQVSRTDVEVSMSAYHGGKNLLSAEPGWYEQVTAIDISSAYPHAMHGFPSFYHEKLYRPFRRSGSGMIKTVPDLGVYTVDGRVIGCRWPSLFTHDFKPLLGGKVEGLCVAGYELNEAIRSGEFKPSKVSGTFYDAEKDHDVPPLKAFVEDFYERKSTATDKPMRAMYKFILNSISGKFIQTRKNNRSSVITVDDDNTSMLKVADEADLIAGGMFQPFIAALITAHTRARIHQVEHEYKTIHTATDGVYTQYPVDVRKFGKGLGSLGVEGKGDLLLLRNKTYVLYGDKPNDPDKPVKSFAFKDKFIQKFALHGFAGTVYDLERMVATNTRTYLSKRVNRLRASVKSGATPNLFVEKAYTLKVGRHLPVHPPLKVSHAKVRSKK